MDRTNGARAILSILTSVFQKTKPFKTIFNCHSADGRKNRSFNLPLLSRAATTPRGGTNLHSLGERPRRTEETLFE